MPFPPQGISGSFHNHKLREISMLFFFIRLNMCLYRRLCKWLTGNQSCRSPDLICYKPESSALLSRWSSIKTFVINAVPEWAAPLGTGVFTHPSCSVRVSQSKGNSSWIQLKPRGHGDTNNTNIVAMWYVLLWLRTCIVAQLIICSVNFLNTTDKREIRWIYKCDFLSSKLQE